MLMCLSLWHGFKDFVPRKTQTLSSDTAQGFFMSNIFVCLYCTYGYMHAILLDLLEVKVISNTSRTPILKL